MQDRANELLRMILLGTGVKIALAAVPFSWLRGGPARAMIHLGELRGGSVTQVLNHYAGKLLHHTANLQHHRPMGAVANPASRPTSSGRQ
jgi:hypothetical protein